MMQAIQAFPLEEYNDISFGLSRERQAINYEVDKDIIIMSITELAKTYGQRYLKGITSGSYTDFRELGSSRTLSTSYTHIHDNSRDDNGGCWVGSNDIGTYIGYVTNLLPKYATLGNALSVISQLFSFPVGSIFLSETKRTLKTNFSYLDDEYLYLNAGSDGGALVHDHDANNGTVGGGSCGINYDIPISRADVEDLSNDIADRIELFLLQFTGTYYPDTDPLQVGDMILQDVAESIPSNYIAVTEVAAKDGLIIFPDDTGDIASEGGVTTHTHPINDGTKWLTTSSSRSYLGSVTTDNHMPVYKAVRLIKRVS